MIAPTDMTGQRFGHLLVTGASDVRLHGKLTVACRCDCGAEKRVVASRLREGRTTSCGCARFEWLAKRPKTPVFQLAEQRRERLANVFSLAYDATHSIPDAIDAVLAVAREIHASTGCEWAEWVDDILASVAAQHVITVEDLVFGGRPFASARYEAFDALNHRGMTFADIGRLFHVHHTTVMAGVKMYRRRAGVPKLRAVG